jgi:hypothetical protein
MFLVSSAADAMQRSRQVEVNGREYTLAEYVGAVPRKGIYVEGNEVNDNGLPQAFLVIQPPGAVTPAHFHEPNQFQVFVEGDGRIGAHATTPLTVQYANGHTPYGPIVASAAGIRYFTLRQTWDPGAKYLPASREKLVSGKQRARVKGGLCVSTDSQRMDRTTTTIDTVFAPERDGLAGWLYRIGPKQTCTLPDPAKGGGQYLVVASGTMISDSVEYARHSVAFISPDETAFPGIAGATGLDLLVLQFPVGPSKAKPAA